MLLRALIDLVIETPRFRALRFAVGELIVQVDSTTLTLCLALLDLNLIQALRTRFDQKVSRLDPTSLSNLQLA